MINKPEQFFIANIQKEKKKEEKKEEKKTADTKFVEEFVAALKDHRFRYINDFKEHHYIQNQKTGGAVTRKFTRRLQNEFFDLGKSLPLHPDASVFVRVKESAISLTQMMIMPANGGYNRGAFLFDVYFPPNYPDVPPLVNLATTGRNTFRFNPNLYKNGKVCLSLLGTWNGSNSEKWNPAVSTFLQVGVSILSAIFVDQPYFNEPGYESQMHTPEGKRQSDQYNSDVRNATLRFAMIDQLKNPPKGFEYVTNAHFYFNRDRIIQQVEGWLIDGVSQGANLKELKPLVEQLKKLLRDLKKTGASERRRR